MKRSASQGRFSPKFHDSGKRNGDKEPINNMNIRRSTQPKGRLSYQGENNMNASASEATFTTPKNTITMTGDGNRSTSRRNTKTAVISNTNTATSSPKNLHHTKIDSVNTHNDENSQHIKDTHSPKPIYAYKSSASSSVQHKRIPTNSAVNTNLQRHSSFHTMNENTHTQQRPRQRERKRSMTYDHKNIHDHNDEENGVMKAMSEGRSNEKYDDRNASQTGSATALHSNSSSSKTHPINVSSERRSSNRSAAQSATHTQTHSDTHSPTVHRRTTPPTHTHTTKHNKIHPSSLSASASVKSSPHKNTGTHIAMPSQSHREPRYNDTGNSNSSNIHSGVINSNTTPASPYTTVKKRASSASVSAVNRTNSHNANADADASSSTGNIVPSTISTSASTNTVLNDVDELDMIIESINSWNGKAQYIRTEPIESYETLLLDDMENVSHSIQTHHTASAFNITELRQESLSKHAIKVLSSKPPHLAAVISDMTAFKEYHSQQKDKKLSPSVRHDLTDSVRRIIDELNFDDFNDENTKTYWDDDKQHESEGDIKNRSKRYTDEDAEIFQKKFQKQQAAIQDEFQQQKVFIETKINKTIHSNAVPPITSTHAHAANAMYSLPHTKATNLANVQVNPLKPTAMSISMQTPPPNFLISPSHPLQPALSASLHQPAPTAHPNSIAVNELSPTPSHTHTSVSSAVTNQPSSTSYTELQQHHTTAPHVPPTNTLTVNSSESSTDTPNQTSIPAATHLLSPQQAYSASESITPSPDPASVNATTHHPTTQISSPTSPTPSIPITITSPMHSANANANVTSNNLTSPTHLNTQTNFTTPTHNPMMLLSPHSMHTSASPSQALSPAQTLNGVDIHSQLLLTQQMLLAQQQQSQQANNSQQQLLHTLVNLLAQQQLSNANNNNNANTMLYNPSPSNPLSPSNTSSYMGIPFSPSNSLPSMMMGQQPTVMQQPAGNPVMLNSYAVPVTPDQQQPSQSTSHMQPSSHGSYINDLQRSDLFSKCRNNRHTLVEELFASGVPVDTTDIHGNQCIHIACQINSKRMLKACLRWGADVNAMNLQGNTPLHFCYAYKYDVLANYILSKGGSLTIKNYFGMTPHEGLKPQDRNEAIFRLRQHMAGIELSEQQIAVVLGESIG